MPDKKVKVSKTTPNDIKKSKKWKVDDGGEMVVQLQKSTRANKLRLKSSGSKPWGSLRIKEASGKVIDSIIVDKVKKGWNEYYFTNPSYFAVSYIVEFATKTGEVEDIEIVEDAIISLGKGTGKTWIDAGTQQQFPGGSVLQRQFVTDGKISSVDNGGVLVEKKRIAGKIYYAVSTDQPKRDVVPSHSFSWDTVVGNSEFSNKNLHAEMGTGWDVALSESLPTSGKWWFRVSLRGASTSSIFGFTKESELTAGALSSLEGDMIAFSNGGAVLSNGIWSHESEAGWSSNNTLGFALDCDSGKVWVYKNGVCVIGNAESNYLPFMGFHKGQPIKFFFMDNRGPKLMIDGLGAPPGFSSL